MSLMHEICVVALNLVPASKTGRSDTINILNTHKATSTLLALFFDNVRGAEDK